MTTNGHAQLAKPHAENKKWWKDAIVYQVYPSSFMDGNGDGTGDLRGVINKVDYLKDLGVDVVWLSPIFKSPLVDMGYDISDYKDINPDFGTVEDVVELSTLLHSKGMKIMLDLVVNHTSDQHEWFKESRSSKTNPKRDWYIWRPAKIDENGNRRPPSNWQAAFQGSVWEWDETTEEYYLHYFCPEQPDLNWENPDVRNAVWDVMHFWLKKGVDGFRQDVINMVSKRLEFKDAPEVVKGQFLQPGWDQMVDGPRMHEFLHEMYTEVLQHYDTMTVGEMPGVYEAERILKYVHPDSQELQMAFDFALVHLDSPHRPFPAKQWELQEVKDIITRFCEGLYEGWWAIYLENHDQGRSISRWTSDSPEYRYKSSKLLSTMQLTLFGTPYIYQGQEIGQINLPLDYPEEELKDIETINFFKAIRARKPDPKEAKEEENYIRYRSRDNARSPVQWSSAPNGGFTTPEAKPWQMISPDYKICNVESQLNDPASVRSYWKNMIKIRKQHEVLVYGRYRHLSGTHEQIFSYTRTAVSSTASSGYDIVMVLLNFTDKNVSYTIPKEGHEYIGDLSKAKKIVGSYDQEKEGAYEGGLKDGKVELRAYEGLVYQVGF